MLKGSCHCQAITVSLETSCPPNELPVRLCGCTFCARHRPRYTTDPAGHVTIRAVSEQDLIRYRFGLQLADFLLCRTCGVFVGAWEPGPLSALGSSEGPALLGRAVLNLVVLDRASELVAEATQFTAYDSEDVTTRNARRARAWTPATLLVQG